MVYVPTQSKISLVLSDYNFLRDESAVQNWRAIIDRLEKSEPYRKKCYSYSLVDGNMYWCDGRVKRYCHATTTPEVPPPAHRASPPPRQGRNDDGPGGGGVSSLVL